MYVRHYISLSAFGALAKSQIFQLIFVFSPKTKAHKDKIMQKKVFIQQVYFCVYYGRIIHHTQLFRFAQSDKVSFIWSEALIYGGWPREEHDVDAFALNKDIDMLWLLYLKL